MGQLTHDDEGISKNSNMHLFIGAAIFLSNLWYYGYPAFVKLAGNQPNANIEKVRGFIATFYSMPYYTLFLSAIFFGMYIWGHRKSKTPTYIPTPMIKIWLPLLVKLELHPKFEYTKTTDRNGKPAQEKKRERIEGQFCIGLGIFSLLIAPLFVSIFQPFTYLYSFLFLLYAFFTIAGFAYIILGGDLVHSMAKDAGNNDPNNTLQESFLQVEKEQGNEYSVNLKTEYMYKGVIRHGWLNIINPFRATQVLGTPGSGKSYAVINEFIRQHLKKHFSMYCYDFKFPDLSTIVYNHYRWNKDDFRKEYGVEPQFCVINFDDPRKSLRCNPVSAKLLTFIADASESAEMFMLGLNKTWDQKQGDFFVESAKTYFSACLWFLKCYKSSKPGSKAGEYCTIPHALELAMANYMDVIPLLTANKQCYTYMINFFNSWEAGAQEQLQGQVASTQLAVAKLASPELYWIMSGDDFSLDINDPENPKILCMGNNPRKQAIYSASLSLYNGRIMSIVNQKHKHKCSLIIDELPTIFIRGLETLISTARSNRVSTCLGYQDFTQLIRDYGHDHAESIINTVGNTFSGMVTGNTAKTLSEQFGRNIQERITISTSETGSISSSTAETLDSLVPANKISTLSQGEFVGFLCDDHGDKLSEKRFCAQITIDSKVVKHEESLYQPLPTFYSFDNKDVAKKLCQKVIDILKDTNYFVASYILKQNKLPSIDDFKKMLDMGDNINVKKTINMIFSLEHNGPKQIMMAELFYDYGKKYCKKAINHKSTLLSIISKLKDSNLQNLKKDLLDEIESFENETSEWLEFEKKVSSMSNASVSLLIKKIKSDINSFNSSDLTQNREYFFSIIKKYSSNLYNVFDNYVSIKKQLQDIRDERMNEVLYKNMDKIRADINLIIKDMLIDLYNNHTDFWDRRLKVLKLKEVDELKRLGVPVNQ